MFLRPSPQPIHSNLFRTRLSVEVGGVFPKYTVPLLSACVDFAALTTSGRPYAAGCSARSFARLLAQTVSSQVKHDRQR